MGYLKYVRALWRKPTRELTQPLLYNLRREEATVRLERPTRIDRARSLGYRAKPGVIVVRQRVLRGGRMRPDIKHGRRSAHSSQRKIVKKSYQQVAEERANKKHQNCEVLGSYKLIEDGKHAWYEVLLLDRMAPGVQQDKEYKNVAAQRGRVYRGLTSAGKKSRGLRQRGQGAEKIRPGLRANKRRH